MNGNGAPRTGDWFYWWWRVKGVKGIFFFTGSMRGTTSKLFCFFLIVAHCRNKTCGSGKRGRTHVWKQAQMTRNFSFQFSEN